MHLPCTIRVPCRCSWGIWSPTRHAQSTMQALTQSPVAHPQSSMQVHTEHLVTHGALLGRHAGAHGAPSHPWCALTAPCRCTWGTCAPMVTLQATVQLICGAPAGTCSLVQPQSTPRVPCRRSRGTRPPAVHPLGAMQVHIGHPFTTMHPQGAMMAHMGHPFTCGIPSGCHADGYGAPGDL